MESSPRGENVRRAIVVAAALMSAACAAVRPGAARDEVADAERAFARNAQEVGIRAAFIAYFAPDGLVFEPAPVRLRDEWPKRPAPADPRALRLEWGPMLVDAARAGDLGLSTGPYRLSDTTGKRGDAHGVFFSVWQRQGDGTWKVWLDLGGRTPAPVDAAAWSAQPRPREGAPQQDVAVTSTAILALDRGLSGLAPDAFAQRLAVDARRHRDGAFPAVGAAWRDELAGAGTTTAYEPAEARVSASGDFAATHGAFVRRAADGRATRGYYVHVWLRDRGAWSLAVEASLDEAPQG